MPSEIIETILVPGDKIRTFTFIRGRTQTGTKEVINVGL